MSFDEQPDGDIHGECSAEIHRLEGEVTIWRNSAEAQTERLKEAEEAISVIDGIGDTLRADSLDAAIDKASALTDACYRAYQAIPRQRMREYSQTEMIAIELDALGLRGDDKHQEVRDA
jgi:hypothetical protein